MSAQTCFHGNWLWMLIRVASHLRVITTAKHFRSPALSYRNIQCIGNWKTTVGGNDGFEPSRGDKLGKLNGTPQKPHALRRIPLACFCYRGGEGHCFRVNAVNMQKVPFVMEPTIAKSPVLIPTTRIKVLCLIWSSERRDILKNRSDAPSRIPFQSLLPTSVYW